MILYYVVEVTYYIMLSMLIKIKMALHMAAMVFGSPVVWVFLLVFPFFLFVKHDQFHQG